MAILTMAILTMAILTMAILTMAILTMSACGMSSGPLPSGHKHWWKSVMSVRLESDSAVACPSRLGAYLRLESVCVSRVCAALHTGR